MRTVSAAMASWAWSVEAPTWCVPYTPGSRENLLHDGAHWHGVARGERWRDELARGTEVKGATLTALSVRHSDAGWEARCVVDV